MNYKYKSLQSNRSKTTCKLTVYTLIHRQNKIHFQHQLIYKNQFKNLKSLIPYLSQLLITNQSKNKSSFKSYFHRFKLKSQKLNMNKLMLTKKLCKLSKLILKYKLLILKKYRLNNQLPKLLQYKQLQRQLFIANLCTLINKQLKLSIINLKNMLKQQTKLFKFNRQLLNLNRYKYNSNLLYNNLELNKKHKQFSQNQLL